MSKLLQFGPEAREKIKTGVNLLADAVSATMGPKGRNVVLGKLYGPPNITKDGVSVAREVDVSDVFENIGVQLVKEVAHKTAEDAGDGTTTATVLARAIYNEGLKLISAGHDPMSIKRGINKAVRGIVELLEANSRPVETTQDIINVGTISANNEKAIGQIIAEAMDKVGRDGVISIEEQTRGVDTTLDVVEGMQFDSGWLTPYFVTNADTMTTEYKNVYVLIHESPITSVKFLLPLLQQVSEQAQSMGKHVPLLIISDTIEGQPLAVLVANKTQGTFPSVAVKAPYIGDRRKAFLHDIAAVTGATVISQESGRLLKDATIKDLGLAESIKITRDTTTIVGGQGEAEKIQERVSQIRHELQNAPEYDTAFLKERLAKLTSGVAVINVGGNTEVEVREKLDRIDDALNATRAAVEEGIVAGGGVALLRARNGAKVECTEEEQYGVNIILKAIEKPLEIIAKNAGESPDVIIKEVLACKHADVGFNALTCQFENLIEAGVIDPTKVVRSALENAASIAGLMLTTEVVIVDEPKQVVNKEQEN